MPADIGPELHLARFHSRPRTSPAKIRNRNRVQSAKSDEVVEKVELLEYEWPDLPPIPCMKDAITRQRVSRGICYLLPVDKGRNSINNKYRTDLRAMFQEPYATEYTGYDDNRVKLSAKIHFLTNAVDTKWTNDLMQKIPVQLNADSENMRKQYAKSAPSGDASRRMGIDPKKLRTRSNLFLPIKAEEHPEAIKLREEAEKIIQTVQEQDDDDEDDEEYNENEQNDEHKAKENSVENPSRKTSVLEKPGRKMSVWERKFSEAISHLQVSCQKPPRLKLTADKFDSYENLKLAKPPKLQIPEMFQSRFLKKEQNQSIWDWLHYGEGMSDFEYFLSICG